VLRRAAQGLSLRPPCEPAPDPYVKLGYPLCRASGWEHPTGSQSLPGIMFDWLDDFLKLYFARTIFRADSSFSWWAATLSPTAKVFVIETLEAQHRSYSLVHPHLLTAG
jgi:hypothetical protein